MFHRDEALSLMEGRGRILETASEISSWIRESGLSVAVIGGIAVVLHGHWRSTRDIDLLVSSPIQEVAALLESHGFHLDSTHREFISDGIPVHLILPEPAGITLRRMIEIEGVLTVPLSDLIEMKLRSGTKNLLLAQDLADVIGLIRHHKLTSEFARSIEKTLRPAFRKLVRSIERAT
jgi:Nucleotidyltransferase of unknown function (DUF6036)